MAENANQNKGFTTIKIIGGDDGTSYKMEIVEPDAKNGSRIDQKVANYILSLDNQMRDPNFVGMMQQARQNPQGLMQQMFQRFMGGGMPMGGMGGGFNPMGMFMGGGR